MLSLSSRSCSVTIDRAQERIFFVERDLSHGDRPVRIVPFADVDQVQLDCWEDSYTVQVDDYGERTYLRRSWVLSLALGDGSTVIIGEESTDQGTIGGALHAEAGSRWEYLAMTVSEQLGKPLVRMGTVPGGPHTFVEAIDGILQQGIRRSGLVNISAHIRTAKDLGVGIEVNGKRFSAVDEVEPEAIRRLIQESVDQWQGGSGHRR